MTVIEADILKEQKHNCQIAKVIYSICKTILRKEKGILVNVWKVKEKKKKGQGYPEYGENYILAFSIFLITFPFFHPFNPLLFLLFL